MIFKKFWKKEKRNEVPVLSVPTAISKEGKTIDTLLDLTTTGMSYWRFSQSVEGCAGEQGVYASYVEGEYTYAQDEERKLSFVDQNHIGFTYMYGDILTKVCVDVANDKFKAIQNNKVHYSGGFFGEYNTDVILVEKNYSLKNKKAYELLFEMTPATNRQQIHSWLYVEKDSLVDQVRKYGYEEAVKFLEYLKANSTLATTKDEYQQLVAKYPEF